MLSFASSHLSVGLSGVSKGQLLSGGERLSLRSPRRQHYDRHQRQHRHCMHGLHQGSVLPRKVQVLPPAGSPAGQNKGCPAPGEPGHSRRSHGEQSAEACAHSFTTHTTGFIFTLGLATVEQMCSVFRTQLA